MVDAIGVAAAVTARFTEAGGVVVGWFVGGCINAGRLGRSSGWRARWLPGAWPRGAS